MIDIAQLTQEQLWGLQYAAQEANKPIVTANENLPEGEDPKVLFTPESYAEMVFKSACDSYYAQLLDYKKKSALQMFDALSAEQQAALVEQLGIPDVIQQ